MCRFLEAADEQALTKSYGITFNTWTEPREITDVLFPIDLSVLSEKEAETHLLAAMRGAAACMPWARGSYHFNLQIQIIGGSEAQKKNLEKHFKTEIEEDSSLYHNCSSNMKFLNDNEKFQHYAIKQVGKFLKPNFATLLPPASTQAVTGSSMENHPWLWTLTDKGSPTSQITIPIQTSFTCDVSNEMIDAIRGNDVRAIETWIGKLSDVEVRKQISVSLLVEIIKWDPSSAAMLFDKLLHTLHEKAPGEIRALCEGGALSAFKGIKNPQMVQSLLLYAQQEHTNLHIVNHVLRLTKNSNLDPVLIRFGLKSEDGSFAVTGVKDEVKEAVKKGDLQGVETWLSNGGIVTMDLLRLTITEAQPDVLKRLLEANQQLPHFHQVQLDRGFGIGMGNGRTLLDLAVGEALKNHSSTSHADNIRLLVEYGAREAYYAPNCWIPSYPKPSELEQIAADLPDLFAKNNMQMEPEAKDATKAKKTAKPVIIPYNLTGGDSGAVGSASTTLKLGSIKLGELSDLIQKSLATVSEDAEATLKAMDATQQDSLEAFMKTGGTPWQTTLSNLAESQEAMKNAVEKDGDKIDMGAKVRFLRSQIETFQTLLEDPLTHAVMDTPILLPSGGSADRATLEADKIARGKSSYTDPLTGSAFMVLHPNPYLLGARRVLETLKAEVDRFERDPNRTLFTGEVSMPRAAYGKLNQNLQMLYTAGPLKDSVSALASCYGNAFEMCKKHNLTDVIVPIFSVGEGRVSLENGIKCLSNEIQKAQAANPDLKVTVACYSEEQANAVRKFISMANFNVQVIEGKFEEIANNVTSKTAVLIPTGGAFRPHFDQRPSKEAYDDAGNIGRAIHDASAESFAKSSGSVIPQGRGR